MTFDYIQITLFHLFARSANQFENQRNGAFSVYYTAIRQTVYRLKKNH